MKLIPVVDLMHCHAVQAKRGLRETYQPLQSTLCATSDPFDVIAGLLDCFPFDTLYLADLDRLMGNGTHAALIERMAIRYPGVQFWVDAGGWFPGQAGIPVMGSESLTGATWKEMPHKLGDWILSLDFFEGRLKGPAEILAQPDAWPERVIVMDLSRVGSLEGPNLSRLNTIHRLSPGQRIIAAGGVRNSDDIEALAEHGIHAVLLASALHNGSLDRVALRKWQGLT